jgi:uncharacterized protein YydD (DUF2326 family)
MKLSRLYTNQPERFQPIEFRSGLNVVMAEIRLAENRKKDTHNLGKTTLGLLLDFCFLRKRSKEFFLFKHQDFFADFAFFLELALADGTFLTVRRSVDKHSKIFFKKHRTGIQDFSDHSDAEWDHPDVPLSRATKLLDSLLNWRGLKPWPYRMGLGYLLRSQNDFNNVYHLNKFKGGHSEWKPFVAHTLGFDQALLKKQYSFETKIKNLEAKESAIKQEFGGNQQDISEIEGILLLKQREVEKKQQLLDAFDFRTRDLEQTKQLVDEVDEDIARLNNRRYTLGINLKKINKALDEDQILFDPDEAERLFVQAGVLFAGQIKRDFEQLIDFNRAITDERQVYLQEEKGEIEAERKQINTELESLGKKRSDMLAFLSDTDVFNKYKETSQDLVDLRTEIKSLENRRTYMHRLQQCRVEIRKLKEESSHIRASIEQTTTSPNENRLFTETLLYFNEIVEEVISRKALLSVSVNKLGHLEFKAEILDERGNTTSADAGHTYRKLLCIAFDLAVLRAHLDVLYPRFVFHDGVFESLDDRKKRNLLSVLRKYEGLGIQSIITLIDSDLPHGDEVFSAEERILKLHDQGPDGRLFKMETW